MKRYTEPMTPEEIAALPDSEIDFSDIPETDDTFGKGICVVFMKEREG